MTSSESSSQYPTPSQNPTRALPKLKYLSVLALLLLGGQSQAWLLIDDARRAPVQPTLQDGRSYALVEVDTESVLAEQGSEQSLPSASLSKLMTSYLVAEALEDGRIRLDQPVVVSDKAWRTAGSRMFLEPGERVNVEQLLLGLIVQSGNDAAISLAELIAGNEESFAVLMNATAKRIGLRASSFVNSTGLDEADGTNQMSARDVSVLLRELILEHEDFYSRFYSNKSYTYQGITQYNRNRLLWNNSQLFVVDGGKTGHTEAAGYSLAASGWRDNMRLVAVVMGSSSEKQRAEDVKALLVHGFSYYEKRMLYSEQANWQQVRVWEGDSDFVGVSLRSPLTVIYPRGGFEQLGARVRMEADYPAAPIVRGQPLGYIEVSYANQTILEHALYATDNVRRANFFKTFKDRVRVWMMQRNLI